MGLDRDGDRQVFHRHAVAHRAGSGCDVIARRGHGPASAPASSRRDARPLPLDFGGEYHYRLDGENHLWNPETIAKLQHAVIQNDWKLYDEYAAAINDQSRELMTLRGLFEFVPGEPVPLDEVEPAAEIVKRFYTGAMSHGSISREAHEMLAIATNRLGGNVQYGRRGRGPAPLPAAAQRRLGQLRHQAGGQRAVRRDDRIPGQRADLADQDGARGQAGRRRAIAGPQGDRGDRPACGTPRPACR